MQCCLLWPIAILNASKVFGKYCERFNYDDSVTVKNEKRHMTFFYLLNSTQEFYSQTSGASI